MALSCVDFRQSKADKGIIVIGNDDHGCWWQGITWENITFWGKKHFFQPPPPGVCCASPLLGRRRLRRRFLVFGGSFPHYGGGLRNSGKVALLTALFEPK